jgi:hypothetical protein
VKWFRKPAVEERVVSILTFFCKSRGVAYRQGLNEVLAPFLMLRVNDATAYHLLTAMVNRVSRVKRLVWRCCNATLDSGAAVGIAVISWRF